MVQSLPQGIREEGIFRKAGNAARIKQIRAKCDEQKGSVDFEALSALPHDVSAILKQFLRRVLGTLIVMPFSLLLATSPSRC